MNRQAVLYALLSAALFGAATPAAKALLGTMSPAILAGLLYCGAGIGLAILRRAARGIFPALAGEASLARSDLPWLAAAIATGGIAGPLLLMAGLAWTEASTASLLLTLEGVTTALIAWFVFKENVDRRVALGMVCLVAGAMVLSWSGRPALTTLLGPLAIVAACIAWGLDNNFTRKLSLADPMQVAEIKGLVAGPVNLVLGLAAGAALPAAGPALLAGIVGFFGYGISLALFIAALRHLGTARTTAYFSTAPFIGAAAAIFALGEPLTGTLVLAGLLMAAGVWLHLTEVHDHEHVHEAVEHSHMHVHDAHHQHHHLPSDPPGEPHSHPHRHAPIRHRHAHMPDMHHQHRH